MRVLVSCQNAISFEEWYVFFLSECVFSNKPCFFHSLCMFYSVFFVNSHVFHIFWQLPQMSIFHTTDILMVATCDEVRIGYDRHNLVGTRESLVVTRDPLVVTRYYLVRRYAFLCFPVRLCSAFGRPALDL